MREENFIVKGVCFTPFSANEIETLKNLKRMATEFMTHKLYSREDFNAHFSENNFLSMTFHRNLPLKQVKELQEKNNGWFEKIFPKKGKHISPWHEALATTDNRIPLEVKILINLKNLPQKKGALIKVFSEPTALAQTRLLGYPAPRTESEISSIVAHNKIFVEELMTIFAGEILEEPKPLDIYYQSLTIDKLEKTGFGKIANHFRKAKSKMYEGHIEDGLTDLRSALDNFLIVIVKQIKKEPTDKIKTNLRIIYEAEYLEKFIFLMINEVDNKIYTYLSKKPVHAREKISLKDAEFCFTIFEKVVDLLIEKVIFRSG